jgi:hypothetical protein
MSSKIFTLKAKLEKKNSTQKSKNKIFNQFPLSPSLSPKKSAPL